MVTAFSNRRPRFSGPTPRISRAEFGAGVDRSPPSLPEGPGGVVGRGGSGLTTSASASVESQRTGQTTAGWPIGGLRTLGRHRADMLAVMKPFVAVIASQLLFTAVTCSRG